MTLTTATTDPGFDWASFWTMAGLVYNSWPVQVLVIIIVAVLVRLALKFVIRRVVDRVVNGVKKKQNTEDTQALSSPLAAVRVVQRTRTLGSVLGNVVTAAIVITASLSIITTINPNITGAFALITAALGAGLGFGAQNIVKDVLSGLFMVAEDQIGVGDVVDLGPATGIVEDVGIRITKIRDVNGTLWFVRNGEILRVGNMSQGWARVIIDLAIPYDADVDAVQVRMLETGMALANDPKWRTRVLERPEIWGIETISAEAIVIRIVVKTRSAAKDDVARELRSRLKRALDEMQVKMPALNSITLSGFEGATSVKGARPPRTRDIATQEPPAALRKTRASRKAPTADPRGMPSLEKAEQAPAAPARAAAKRKPSLEKPPIDGPPVDESSPGRPSLDKPSLDKKDPTDE
jgi:small-conductance mechanosensitive channel